MGLQAAVVGAGGIAQVHLGNLQRLNVDIVGVCDLSEDRARRAAEKFGGAPFTEPSVMLEAVTPDFVLICTPPKTRLELVREVAERGIPCFMEKPPAFDRESAHRIRQIIESARIVHSVGFMWRWSTAVESLQRLLKDEKVAFIRSHYFYNLFFNPGHEQWFLDKSRSGGPVVDQAIHILDLCRYILGDATSIHAFGNNVLLPKKQGTTAEEAVVMNVRYKSGVIQSHTHSWAHTNPSGSIDVYTSEKRYSLDLTGAHALRVYTGGEILLEEINEENHPYLQEMEGFIRAVRSGDMQHVRSTFDDAVRTLELVLAANESLDLGGGRELGDVS